MRSKLAGVSLLLASAMLAATLPARAEVSLHVDISNAPPPPRVVFVERPNRVYEPECDVYVVEQPGWGYDTFQYHGYWYICNDNYWYRSLSYRGPFVVIRETAVPAAIWRVPPKRWRHHPHGGPPGYYRKADRFENARDRRDVIVVKEKKRGHGRDH